MIAKTEEDFQGLKEAGKIMGLIRDEMVKKTLPGITTKEFDDFAGELFEKHGAIFQVLKVNITFQDLHVSVSMMKWHMGFQVNESFKKAIS